MSRTEWGVILGFVAFCALYYLGIRKPLALAQRHAETTASVIECYTHDGTRYVVFEFMVNGEPYHGDVSVISLPDNCRSKPCCIGLKLKVLYAPEDPLNNRIVEGWWR